MMLCFATVVCAANGKFTLVIDAGHGGHDAGALGKFSKEKNINLNVALAFGRLVERNCPDVRVIYTRKTDVFIPLHQRADIANKNKADLFVSIHTNALPKGRIARGLETYTLGMNRASDNFDVAKRENSVILIEKDYKQRYAGFDPNSSESYIMFEFMQDKNMEKSVELAKSVQKRTCAAASRPNKGVKQAGFLVLRETSMPSCLIELGFITTPDEERLLNSENGIESLGRGIYQAFIDYKNKYDINKKVTYNPIETPEKPAARQSKNDEKAENAPAKVEKTRKTKADETPRKSIRQTTRNSKSMAEELADARNGVDTDTQKQPKETAATRALVEQEPETKTPPQTTTSRDEGVSAKPEPTEAKADEATAVPIFKVQILASSTRLKATDKKLEGAGNVESYKENDLYKYTVGASANYNEIYRLRKSILDKFPEAFIIAFKNGEKMNVVEAIKEFKSNRNKK